MAESLEHLRPWTSWAANEPLDEEERRARIRGWAESRDQFLGMWLDGEVVGGCGLHDRIGPGGREIGYWVHAAHTGRGLATQAVRLLIERAFADPAIDRVEIHHDLANVASGRVPARLGFEHVDDHPRAPDAPAHVGTDRIWRLERAERIQGRIAGIPAA